MSGSIDKFPWHGEIRKGDILNVTRKEHSCLYCHTVMSVVSKKRLFVVRLQ